MRFWYVFLLVSSIYQYASAQNLAVWTFDDLPDRFEPGKTQFAGAYTPSASSNQLRQAQARKSAYTSDEIKSGCHRKAWSTRNWNNQKLDTQRYLELVLSPKSDRSLVITKLSFTAKRTGQGPENLVVRSSTDNFGRDLLRVKINKGKCRSYASGVLRLEAAEDSSVRLRFYAWGAKNPAQQLRLDDIRVQGDLYLPIDLQRMDARQVAQGIMVRWVTDWERGNERFHLERSRDGQQYTKIATFKGRGTTKDTTLYTWIDRQPAARNYYRLRQVDFDGSSSTYGPIFQHFSGSTAPLRLWPNPARRRLNISYDLTTTATVELYDSQGILRKRWENVDFPRVALSLPRLSRGLYRIRIKGPDMQQSAKLLVH